LIKESNFQHLIIEFELALQFGQDLPFRSEPWTAQSIGPMVECAYPCLELADDRYARYDHLKAHFFTLVAENAWNHGVVLGSRIEARNFAKLWQTLGVAKVNGEMIGHGRSQDVMGHPLKALAWLANEIQRRGRPILAGQWVTTGSWVASTFPHAGQTLSFVFEDMAEVCVHIV
jgi:2-keto-4-pentenoate hydratase